MTEKTLKCYDAVALTLDYAERNLSISEHHDLLERVSAMCHVRMERIRSDYLRSIPEGKNERT